jgi:hypothetical protein
MYAPLSTADALILTDGDLLISKTTEAGEVLYFLDRDNSYDIKEVLTLGEYYDFLYDIDGAKPRLYLRNLFDGNYYYIDLNEPPYEIKRVDWIPEGADISCVARDGSALILDMEAAGDIFAEENPIGAWRGNDVFRHPPRMLYKYDLATKEITRLTYFYTQVNAWLSNDGEILVYQRWSRPVDGGYKPTYVIMNMDTLEKYDQTPFINDAGEEYGWLFRSGYNGFAPRGFEDHSGKRSYRVYLDKPHDVTEGYRGSFTYYIGAIAYDDGASTEFRKCDVSIPPGVIVNGVLTVYSRFPEVYLVCADDKGVRFISVYDEIEGTFSEVPNTRGCNFVVAY